MSERGHLSTYARSVVPDAANRDPLDFYPTPPGATRALLRVEAFDGPIWEPAAGTLDMVNVLRAAGHEVLASDIVARGFGVTPMDFLLASQMLVNERQVRHLVTNPPFRLAEDFVRHARAVVPGKVCLLVRLAWLEGLARRKLFADCGLSRVWVFSDRAPFQRGRLVRDDESGGRMMAYMWAVFDPAHSGPPQLGWVSFGEAGSDV